MTEQIKRPVGRPKKTLEDLPENWKQIMLDLAQDGDGPTCWKVYLGLSNDGYSSLLENYEEFSTTVLEANALHQLYYERESKRMIKGGAGNSNVFALVMYNKFGWGTSKTESKIVSEIKADVTTANRDLTKEELLKQLQDRGLPTTLLIEKKDES